MIVRQLPASSQFGVQTMAYYGCRFRGSDDDDEDNKTGTFALHTLNDDETIARLATGIKRFKLPDEFNFIKLYQRDRRPRPARSYGEQALEQPRPGLREPPAVSARPPRCWKRAIEEYGPGDNNYRQQRLDQIVGNWGRFEHVQHAARRHKARRSTSASATASKVSFEAHAINVDKLLADVKAYLKSNPGQLDWNKINIGDIGYRLVEQNQTAVPRREGRRRGTSTSSRAPDHFDDRITVDDAAAEGRRLSRHRQDGGRQRQPHHRLARRHGHRQEAARRQVVLLRRRRRHRPAGRRRPTSSSSAGSRSRSSRTPTSSASTPPTFAETTDADGQVILGADKQPQQLPVADHRPQAEGRPGRRPLRLPRLHQRLVRPALRPRVQRRRKVFTITDRPVYRPEQTVQVQVLGPPRQVRPGRHVRLRRASRSPSQIHNPKGEKVFAKTLTADDYGGIAGEFALPTDATLGVYQRHVVNHGGGTFRVEEYKKPEFEVTVDAPDRAGHARREDHGHDQRQVLLRLAGHQRHGEVQGHCARSTRARWYPAGRWDWLYGPGYWWFAYDYAWYPGWRDWGCLRPIALVVAGGQRSRPRSSPSAKCRSAPTARSKVEIDTRRAKALHADQDHQLHDHGRGGRRIAPHDRRHRQRARRPQAVPGLRLGRPRLLPRRRHDRGQLHRPDARPEAGRRARAS